MRRARIQSRLTFCVAILLLLFAGQSAHAQERIETLLQRGYVSEWLVCGPFASDITGGIGYALKRGEVPLGEKDYLESIGGVARARPKESTAVRDGGTSRTFSRVRAEDPLLDLSPVFKSTKEGIAYAAFSVRSGLGVLVYFDVQTPLGARMWLNGFPLRSIRPAPITAGGVDRFAAELRTGVNTVVIEAPFLDLGSLAGLAGMSSKELATRGFRNRPLLKDPNGFQLALRILPAQTLGKLVFVPRLDSTGSFSGRIDNASQDVLLTVFNPQSVSSLPVAVSTTVHGVPEPVRQVILPVPPESQKEVILSIPTGGAPPGGSVEVEVTLTLEGQSKSFSRRVDIGKTPEKGTIYLVTGAHYQPDAIEDQRDHVERRMAEIDRNLIMMDGDPDYGFHLGTGPVWKPYWQAHPAKRQALEDTVAELRTAPSAGHGIVDERIVTGETLARNLAHGYRIAEHFLDEPGRCYLAWNAVAIAPQTPQLLGKAHVRGIVSNLPIPGLPSVFSHLAPDGSHTIHRRKQPSSGLTSIGQLKENAAVQRRELLSQGITSDVLVNVGVISPPEPFFLGECGDLARSLPSIKITGAGGESFLNDAWEAVNHLGATIPATGRLMTTQNPGELLAQRDLKQAHSRVENMLITAEKLATCAATIGAAYPAAALDHAWRQLLFGSTPDRLGFAQTPRNYIDTLLAYRDAATTADEIVRRATAHIAQRANTNGPLPARAENVIPLLVFNPSIWPRTDVCVTSVSLPGAVGLTVTDDKGRNTPFLADRITRSQGRLTSARLTFVARNIPSLGYATYYIHPQGAIPAERQDTGAIIENEFLRIAVDPDKGGAIVSLSMKEPAKEFANGLINDLLALDELGELTRNGRELWTTRVQTRASAGQAEVARTTSAVMQRLTVTTGFLDGKAIREITLYAGIPRVDCTIRLEGVTLHDTTAVATFQTWSAGHAPVFGERYGAVVGRSSPRLLELQTSYGENVSGSGYQPALRWAALSPNDHLRASADVTVPLAPAVVIYGEDPSYQQLARLIQETWIQRGIPCVVLPGLPKKKDPVWSDSTEFDSPAEALKQAASMRIFVGGPKDSKAALRILLDAPEEVEISSNKRIAEGSALFFNDTGSFPERGPVPTLILGGNTPKATQEIVKAVAKSVLTTGIAHLSPKSLMPADGSPQPATGLAILHEGATIHEIARNGTMAMGLAHGSRWDADPDRLALPTTPPTLEVSYAIYPFTGTWRDARVARAAHAFGEPFVAAQTNLHINDLPPSQAFLEVNDPDFIATAVRGGQGIELRGYESTGTPGTVILRLSKRLRNAGLRNLLGHRTAGLTVQDNKVTLPVGGFSVNTVIMTPSGDRTGNGSPLVSQPETDIPVFTRYWRHNPGAGPPDGLPLTLLLEGDLTDANGQVILTLANNLAKESIQGAALILVPEGWNIAPVQVGYDLKPGEFIERKIVVLRQTTETKGAAISARTTYNGTTYEDTLTIGDTLELAVERSGNEIVALVKNTSSLLAQGHIELALPPLNDPNLTGNRATVTPQQQPVTVSPYSQQRLIFHIHTDPAPPWLTLKLAATGQVRYVRVPE